MSSQKSLPPLLIRPPHDQELLVGKPGRHRRTAPLGKVHQSPPVARSIRFVKSRAPVCRGFGPGLFIPAPGDRPAARLEQSSAVAVEMCEVRFEMPREELDVLDGYCAATGRSRTDVIRETLRGWSAKKLHEATLICRVAGVNPSASDRRRRAEPGGSDG